jgi:hypothetical protein
MELDGDDGVGGGGWSGYGDVYMGGGERLAA